MRRYAKFMSLALTVFELLRMFGRGHFSPNQ